MTITKLKRQKPNVAEVVNATPQGGAPMSTPPDKCPHLQISNEVEGKCACLECGLVQPIGVSNWGYIRSITHYKLLLAEGRPMPPTHCLVGEVLQKQVLKLLARNNAGAITKSFEVDTPLLELYQEYICFLRDNQDLVLPKKERKRELTKIYGEHRRIVIEWITALVGASALS